MEFVNEKKKTPVIKKVDVVVVGGGPAGFAAAVASGRNGAETLLIERYGFLGGMMTTGLVRWLPIDKLIPLKAYGETRPLQGGIVQEFTDRLVDVGGAIHPSVAYEVEVGFDAYFPTDPEINKSILIEILEEAKAEILLHSFAVDTLKEGKKVIGIIIESKSGRQAIMAKNVIDASGDADIAAAAGAEYEKHDPSSMMSLTGFFANVDVQKAIEYSRWKNKAKFDTLMEEAIQKGELAVREKKILAELPPLKFPPPLILDHKKIPSNWYRVGEAACMFESVAGDCTNVNDLTSAELTTRKTVLPILNFFRKYIPGYENAYLAYTNTQIGIRESRRVLGSHILTGRDMEKGVKHEDVVVKCRSGSSNQDLSVYTPERAPVFDIPYRCLVPKVIDGLLVAGRCISIDHHAATLISPRDVATCICLGEAAGTAAALSIMNRVEPRELDFKVLQHTLNKQGANVG